ncbi:MAG: phage holin family protein [Anaerolineae bacterium]|nr:phage holin family protein [Anaerolineae bacterium]
MKLLIRWAISALALFAAVWLVPGIHVDDSHGWMVYAAMALILGLVNAILRPVLNLLALPLIVLTVGIFMLVINAATLMIASSLANNLFHVGFYVDGFWSAFWGSLIVSVVSSILGAIVKDEEKHRPHHKDKK